MKSGSIPSSIYKGALKSSTKWKAFIGRGEQEKEFFCFYQREACFRQGHLPVGMEGVCWADDLTGADQVIPDWLVLGHIPGRGWSHN